MTGRSDRTVVRYCPPCAAGNHSHCTTRIGTRPGAECECGARAHDPVVEVAAQMARYVWGDHAAVCVRRSASVDVASRIRSRPVTAPKRARRSVGLPELRCGCARTDPTSP
jgi:hypothetical protein